MEYYGVFIPSLESVDPENYVFESKEEVLKMVKANKDARFKLFKSRSEALKFVMNGIQQSNGGSNINKQESSSLEALLKSPPPNQPIPRPSEKSAFPGPKSQDLVRFRKEIEQNNVQKVYELININPRYLVSSGDTPSILKEGPRYNALHVAAMNKHARMAKLILQTVEQTQFIETLHGFKNDPNIEVMCQNLLESYLNTPDKSRNETPLHFAAKIGALDVIEVLISYPLCKMKPNADGLYPKDIICARAPDVPQETKKAIEELLNERFFVPVLRSNDNSMQPIIGIPFTPAQMSSQTSAPIDPRSPSMEIKAYAGPMTSEQAQTFHKRWKTPPRLIPSASSSTSIHNISFSPKSTSISSPLLSPRMTKSFNILQSTPKLKKRLFDGNGDGDNAEDFESVYLANVNGNDRNGNHKIDVLNENEEEEFKELFDDLMRDKISIIENTHGKFKAYRNPEPTIPETPVAKNVKNDSNSNHLSHNYNITRLNSNDSLFCNPPSGSVGSGLIASFLDESGSVYSPDNIHDSISFKEKNIRLTDTSKGLEKIGRGLANEYNVGWKEYWDFLGHFLDIRSIDGLEKFEEYLKKKDKQKEVNELGGISAQSPVKQNDSFGLSAICAGLYSMDINDVISGNKSTPKNGLTSPLSSRSPLIEMLSNKRQSTNDLPLDNPYTCIEQSCRTFAKRLASLLESETIQDQNSYEKTLLVEVSKLNTSIDSYKRDSRFSAVNFQKVHARYSYLLVWYLKSNNIEVKYHRNAVPLMSKVYALARQFTFLQDTKDLIKIHSVCISNFTSNYIEHQEKIFNPENVSSETACFDAWNGPDILECKCSFEANFVNLKQRQNHRRDIRKRLYSGSSLGGKVTDLWSLRTPTRDEYSEEEDESYISCSDSDDSDSDVWFTPPQSPNEIVSSDDEMNAFEESLENLEDEKAYALFIDGGDEPTKVDSDVFAAIGEDFVVDEFKYPFVYKWHRAMKLLNSKSLFKNNNFRLFTPKLKIHG